MSEAELGQYCSGGGEAKVLDQVLPQKTHRDRVQQQRALSREADRSAFGVELQQLFVVQIVGAHARVFALRRFEGESKSS